MHNPKSRKMKKAIPVFFLCIIAVTLVFFAKRCTTADDTAYARIRAHADNIRVINTHEHQQRPEELGDHRFGFFHLLALSYLMGDMNSAGAGGYNMNELDTLSLDELWDRYGEALNFCRNTSYYGHFARGFGKLYGFSDPYFTKDNISGLSAKVEKNYKNYGEWFDRAFHEAGFELMFLDQWWNTFNTDIDERYFALVFRVNSLIGMSSRKPARGERPGSIYREAVRDGFEIADLDDYLAYCEHLIRKNIENRAVGLKNAQAYTRTIYYEDVPYDEALELFSRPSASLTPGERKKLEDFMFHWIIQRSIEYNLPVQIHTGYLASNRNTLENGRPTKLNNLFMKYPEAKFVLFHGGFPWTGEVAALGKMFPNVYVDLVWLPQISREEAIQSLDVILDCLPYNKIFWGGDCRMIEESAGSLEFGKDVVAEVLARRVQRGLMTEKLALEITERIFRTNAVEVFRLEEILERSF